MALATCGLLLAVFGTSAGWAEGNPVLGLPTLVVPEDNPGTPAKVALGGKLFFDKRLSRDGTMACATCHVPEKAFSDGRQVAKGIGGQLGSRNTPSLLNVAFATTLFWDGRRTSLEAQATDPLFNHIEHGLPDAAALLKLLREDKAYAETFRSVFGMEATEITVSHVANALAAYERTLIAGGSAFDRYVYGGDVKALSPAAIRGLHLFRGSAQCATCHTIGEHDATFTDGQFHSLGIGFERIGPKLAATAIRVAKANQTDLDAMVLTDHDIAELGRFVVTKNPQDIGKFKTPCLRNVALTAPYMHDGSITTLEAAVDFEVYYRNVSTNRVLALSNDEKADLVAFLESLTSLAGIESGQQFLQSMTHKVQ